MDLTQKQFAALAEIMNHCFIHLWNCSEVCLDETCQPQKKPTTEQAQQSERLGWPIPHHYIIRKPHPNCILSWLAASKSDATLLTFVLFIQHDLTRPKLTGADALKNFLRLWYFTCSHTLFIYFFSIVLT